jgi:hypothetical protein
MLTYFKVPYEIAEKTDGRLYRRIPVDNYSEEIFAAGGFWEEAEINGSQAIVRVRAPLVTVNRIKNNLPVTQLADPTLEWTPTRVAPIDRGGEVAFDSGESFATKTLTQLSLDVLSDQESGELQRIAAQLMRRADQEGYVKLVGYSWEFATKILSYLSANGYPLNRISTGTFPTSSVIDDFNRANEGPPPSSSWDYSLLGGSTNGVKVISNQCGGDAAAAGGRNAYWKTSFGPDCEAYCTLAVSPGATDIELVLRGKDLGTGGADPGSTNDFYSASWEGGTSPDRLEYYRIDNSSFTLLGATHNLDMVSGYKFGFEAIGSTLQAYNDTGSGWATFGTSRSDATYGAAGKVGFWHGGTVCRIDNFGAGTIVSGDPNAYPTVRKVIWATRPA